jgi:hypothetical protein
MDALHAANKRRSLSNPFFQRTQEDLEKEAKADQMKDDLEKLYTNDQLPAAASLSVAPKEGEDMGEKLYSAALWCWTGEGAQLSEVFSDLRRARERLERVQGGAARVRDAHQACGVL